MASKVPSAAALLAVAVLATALSSATAAAGGRGDDPTPAYDGVLRKGADGRMEAYMIPPFKSNHASFVVGLPSGERLIAWFSGSAEGQSDVAIVLSRLEAGSMQWSQADVVSQRHGYSNQNPVLYFDGAKGVLHLFHSQQPADKGETNAAVWTLLAKDGRGMKGNWTAPAEIFGKAGSFTKNRMITSLNGTWMLPMYYATGSSSQQYSHIKTTKTAGIGPWGNLDFDDTSYLVQPTVVRDKPGQPALTAFFRDRRAKHIYVSHSADDGATWDKAEATVLPNNNAGIHATTLQSGNMVMTFNPQTSGRDPLAIALSEDGGKTWPYKRDLENGDPSYEYSYPTQYQSSDGQIHVSYTYRRESIKYCIVSEDWIKAGNASRAGQ